MKKPPRIKIKLTPEQVVKIDNFWTLNKLKDDSPNLSRILIADVQTRKEEVINIYYINGTLLSEWKKKSPIFFKGKKK